jgi:hypothetical protein
MYIFSSHLLDIFSFSHLPHLSISISDLIDSTTVIAQQIPKSDIIGDLQKSWQEFVKTGRLWAMLIGVFFGYSFRSFLP